MHNLLKVNSKKSFYLHVASNQMRFSTVPTVCKVLSFEEVPVNFLPPPYKVRAVIALLKFFIFLRTANLNRIRFAEQIISRIRYFWLLGLGRIRLFGLIESACHTEL